MLNYRYDVTPALASGASVASIHRAAIPIDWKNQKNFLYLIGDCFPQARNELLIPGGTVLSSIEKILFAIAVLVSLYFTYRGVMRIVGHIASGQGKPDWSSSGNGWAI